MLHAIRNIRNTRVTRFTSALRLFCVLKYSRSQEKLNVKHRIIALMVITSADVGLVNGSNLATLLFRLKIGLKLPHTVTL